MSEPHSQINGGYDVQGVLSLGCSVAVLTNGGYADAERHPGEAAGVFSNASTITDVHGVYGRTAQPLENVVNWPSCTVWGDENSPLNYKVTVTGVTAEGFPHPSNRTVMKHWARWEPSRCFYNNTPDDKTAVAEPAPPRPLPQPFSRTLELSSPPLNGSDVRILQHLLHRAGKCAPSPAGPAAPSGTYDGPTARAVACFQAQQGLPVDSSFGEQTAWAALHVLSDDGWHDDGQSAAELGYKYKILLPVHRNRSVETTGVLLDAHNRQCSQGRGLSFSRLRAAHTHCWSGHFIHSRVGCASLNDTTAHGQAAAVISRPCAWARRRCSRPEVQSGASMAGSYRRWLPRRSGPPRLCRAELFLAFRRHAHRPVGAGLQLT